VALEHGDLGAQDQDLGVLSPDLTARAGHPAEHSQQCQVGEA
jgi:hypothetical protein